MENNNTNNNATPERKSSLKVLLDLLENGRDLEVYSFRDKFTADEMGRITYFSDIFNEISDTVEECRECIEMLKDAKNKKSPYIFHLI